MSKCDTCVREKCFHRSHTVVGCSQYAPKQKTNADRIRAMSDEEFSCFLSLVENRKTGKTSFDDTSDFWLEWLKQLAE